jgi:hypothetical protein
MTGPGESAGRADPTGSRAAAGPAGAAENAGSPGSRRPPGPASSVARETGSVAAELDALLEQADADLVERYRGDRPGRQPVHTVYVPADRFEPDLAARWGQDALAALAEHLPLPGTSPT